jgi:putative DNA primase/helicase
MSAETIAKALGGRKTGGSWTVRCPVHEDRTPSLSVSAAKGGKVLVRCHAGCDQHDVIAALRARGLWETARKTVGPVAGRHHRQVRNEPDPEALERTEAALAIWQASHPTEGTLAETYLRSRGLTLPAPASVRFHPGLKHPSGGAWPAMVSLVTLGETGTPVAVHRTFLARDGRGKASLDPAKMMLGPCRCGVVRLGQPAGVLMVGEGIETCLAAMQATGNPAWAALSTAGLRALQLPKDVAEVIVLADGDAAGEAAARHCALRSRRQCRRVRIARPPQGMDFNDMFWAA